LNGARREHGIEKRSRDLTAARAPNAADHQKCSEERERGEHQPAGDADRGDHAIRERKLNQGAHGEDDDV